MFNKRESSDDRSSAPESRKPETPRSPSPKVQASSGTAVIGPSIEIDGTLRGDEDLVIEGRVKGKVELKSHSVTIGDQGNVQADIHAHTIYVDGSMDGNLVASERVVIRQSARIKGSIVSPRVGLEDGARFNGSIDMDPDSEELAKVFSGKRSTSSSVATPAEKPVSRPNGRPPADKDAGGGPSSPKA